MIQMMILGFTQQQLIFLFSKTLGYSIIVASTVIKLPQLLKILTARSSSGLSFNGSLLELLAVTFSCCYSFARQFPFSAWGETFFLTIETFLITFFIKWYDNQKDKAIKFFVIYLLR